MDSYHRGDKIIVGYRPELADGVKPHAGSKRGSCEVCNSHIWLLPSTVELLAEDHSIRVLCMPCSAQEIATAGDVTLTTPDADALVKDLRISPRLAQALCDQIGKVNDITELFREDRTRKHGHRKAAKA